MSKIFELLKAKLSEKGNEPGYQHPDEDYYVGICSAEEVVYDVECAVSCDTCRNKGKCAIYDNFNIQFCSDWEEKAV